MRVEEAPATASGSHERDSGFGCPVRLATSRGGSKRRPWRWSVIVEASRVGSCDASPPPSRRSPGTEPTGEDLTWRTLNLRSGRSPLLGALAPDVGPALARRAGAGHDQGRAGRGWGLAEERRASAPHTPHTPHAPPAATDPDGRRARSAWRSSRIYAVEAIALRYWMVSFNCPDRSDARPGTTRTQTCGSAIESIRRRTTPSTFWVDTVRSILPGASGSPGVR